MFAELISYLKASNEVEVICPILYHQNEYLIEKGLFPNANWRNYLLRSKIRGKYKILEAIYSNKKFATSEISKQNFDIFFSTYYDPYFINHLHGRPYIATVYDMIHEKLSSSFEANDSNETARNKSQVLEKAGHIVAISESTKKDVIDLLNIDPQKIDVIYLNHSISKIQHTSVSGLPEKYILYVGNREGYKNFKLLLSAAAPLLIADPTLTLVCAGSNAFTDHEMSEINSLGIRDKVTHTAFTEDQLGYIYTQAACFVFPSRYEGFGIPALESMAMGCPVVLTNSSSLPEVAGQAGIYFQDGNVESLTVQLKRALVDQEYRNEKIALGLKRVERFSWQTTGQSYLDLAFSKLE